MADVIVDILQNGWQRAVNAARRTVGKDPLKTEPSDKWKAQMLLSEHSPIRLVEYDIFYSDIKMWLTTHLVRHKIGIEHFVHTQREDRQQETYDRDKMPQGALNDMQETANAQALINISRKRLCSKAHPETRTVWKRVRLAVAAKDPIMAVKMVPECIYRGFCPEKESCGFVHTESYLKQLKLYRQEATESNLIKY